MSMTGRFSAPPTNRNYNRSHIPPNCIIKVLTGSQGHAFYAYYRKGGKEAALKHYPPSQRPHEDCLCFKEAHLDMEAQHHHTRFCLQAILPNHAVLPVGGALIRSPPSIHPYFLRTSPTKVVAVQYGALDDVWKIRGQPLQLRAGKKTMKYLTRAEEGKMDYNPGLPPSSLNPHDLQAFKDVADDLCGYFLRLIPDDLEPYPQHLIISTIFPWLKDDGPKRLMKSYVNKELMRRKHKTTHTTPEGKTLTIHILNCTKTFKLYATFIKV